ncbi:MAG: aminopeptidase P family protein [Anaerolineae bacterium]|nr:aminopeptidase P family protein [Anaerolineae bacterium]
MGNITPFGTGHGHCPQVLPVRQRAEIIRQTLQERLASILPAAMRETGFDMWLILCQEDDLDPIFTTMIPMDTWCPILQMLIFYDRGPGQGVERINLSMTNTGDLYDRPWQGRNHEEQWALLHDIISERDPQRIGINTGSTQWAAGGLTYNLYTQLEATLSTTYQARLASAEPLATIWLSTLIDSELQLFEHVTNVAHFLLGQCFSRRSIIPGVTTVQDLEWTYWQQCADLGLGLAFKPFFNLVRRTETKERFGANDQVIRPGDMIHSDVGIRYLRLNSDHQECAYVLQPGEDDAPPGLKRLMAEANRLQDVFMAEFRLGLSGNELLSHILTRARSSGIPNPKVYSHSLGLFLHEPGPLIGLPWEQECCPGRGDVKLRYGNCFTMELSVRDRVSEWDSQEVTMSLEQDVAFTAEGCRLIDGRQTELYLI